METERTINKLREIESMTRNGDVTEAVNQSGELMAKIHYKWESEIKCKPTAGELTELLAEAGAVHVRALVAANEPTIAATTAIALLTDLSIDTRDTTNLDIAKLELLNNALNALAAHINRYETTADSSVIEHYTTILRYLLSLLYALYNKINREQPQCSVLPSAYLTLKQFIAENVPVDTPAVNVNGIEIDPLKPTYIYADILGRIEALRLV